MIHQKNSHGTDSLKQKCELCEAVFKHKRHLKVHMSTVHSERVFECDKCDLKCKSVETLKRHVLVIHSNIEPINCDTCGETFATLAYLKKAQKMKTFIG